MEDNAADRFYCRYIKRAFDLLFSALLLFFLSLPMLFIALAVRIDSKGEAIFKQVRCGREGREFICYKFRTMYSDAPHDRPAARFENAEYYVTRVGRLLRRSSLDELPQLFNVLKGDMSIVGPRPLIKEEQGMHEGRMISGVYKIRPGITGLAQISGRKLLCDEEKLMADQCYLSKMGALVDMGIVLQTLKKVMTREGVGE